MSLQSKLFHGDPNLEAAAVADSAHITLGSSGQHVNRIQAALIVIDGATISPDEVQQKSYGPSTAGSVLTYKQERNIINRSYETQADNIVGKMTMASLDAEMLKQEALPRDPIQIKPLSFSVVRPARSSAFVAFLASSQLLGLDGAAGAAAVGGPSIVPVPSFFTSPSILPNVILELRRNSIGSISVIGASFGDVVVADPAIAKIAPDAPVTPSDRALVVDDPQTFKVFSAKTLGRTTITASSFGSTASIDVVVKTFFDPPKFVPGVNHAHKPSGRYADVQANPNDAPGLFGFVLDKACPLMGPAALVGLAKKAKFSDKPIALKHLDAYLTVGKGADFVEDDNIKDWVIRDRGIRSRLKREIFPRGKKPKGEGHFFFDQSEYEVEDFQFAFGSIDRVDFQVDFSQDTVRVWFQDRYEWHPVYPFYDFQPGDGVRETNCLHAALVELKTSGAADFWMKGQAEVALSLVTKP
jgi:hypothetical protein